MSKIDDIRARMEAAIFVCHKCGYVGFRGRHDGCNYLATQGPGANRSDVIHLLDLVERAQEFAEAAAPTGPPYTVPAHTQLAPGMRTPIQQRAEQWLLEVRGESNVPAGKEGGQP